MAWEKIVQRLGSAWLCCPNCHSVEVEYPEESGLGELATVACRKCGWKGIGYELTGIPAPDAK
ncbi:hypothetical protein PMI42_07667 [Bradyrhizobium sp. YR681]|nr:hypothetical protein PMI42_07667 [Bradyrhizobium sp. YR681]